MSDKVMRRNIRSSCYIEEDKIKDFAKELRELMKKYNADTISIHSDISL